MTIEGEQKVYDILKELNIPYVKREHIPVFTIEEANQLEEEILGQNCKNLFIRNRKGDQHYLVVMIDSKRIDLKNVSKQIDSTSLSFASEKRLYQYLKLTPGSVTPFGLINDNEKHVKVLLDKDLREGEDISFHPNVNTATITIAYKDFEKFLGWCGNPITYIEV
ncbi:prolyl-tRNA synthetase associated domain-containing protein [Clostridiaceae bacterium 35-E11]